MAANSTASPLEKRVTVDDPVSGATVKFSNAPRAPSRGRHDCQTAGCYCRVCSDPENTTEPCEYKHDDLDCYCRRCTNPDDDRECYRSGQKCGRCGRRDWKALDVAAEPSICSRCRYELFHASQQANLTRWSV